LLNPKKANSYIYNAFLGSFPDIDESLSKNISYGRMSEFVNYGTSKFDRVVNLSTRIITDYASLKSKYTFKKLGEIARYSASRINCSELSISTYVGVDNLLPNVLGKVDSQFLPQEGTATSFSENNILLSNIRPYLKKIWYANNSGGASGDVLVLEVFSEDVFPKYLYYHLATDRFFDFEMQHVKGVKMPRADKNAVLNYPIPIPPFEVQQKIVAEIGAIETEEILVNTEIQGSKDAIGSLYDDRETEYKDIFLNQIVKCNPSKSELADTSDDTIVSFVEMASVSNEGYIITTVNRPLLDIRKGSYTYFRENDVIIAKITPCMENGKCALAVGLTNGIGMGSSEFHVFRCGDRIFPRYLFCYLNRPFIRNEAEKRMTGASGHRRVPISFYEQLTIPLPPLNKQKEIVAKIEQYEAKIEQLKKHLVDLNAMKNDVLERHLN